MADIAGNTSTTSLISGTGTYASTLELNLDSDWWRMSLTGGLTYAFRVTGDGSANSLDDARISIRDSLGNSLGYQSDGQTLTITPTTSGTFYIDIADLDQYDNAAEGNYVISTWMTDFLQNNSTTTGLVSGTGSVNGQLTENTDSDWYKVSLVAGRSYAFWVTGDGSASSLDDARLSLRDALGNSIKSASDGYQLSFTAAKSGTYFLDVEDTDYYDLAGEGRFVLTSRMDDRVLNNNSTTAVIQNGHELRGRIDAAQDHDWYRLNTIAGVTYELKLNGVGADALSENLLILMDANGNRISSDAGYSSGGAVLTFKAGSAGPYYLNIGSQSIYDADIGNFILGVRSDARSVVGTSGNDSLSGMDNNNIISGLAGDDVMRGNGGDDRLAGGLGNDTMSGGSGFDIAEYTGSTAVRVDLRVTTAQNTGLGNDKLSLIEGVLGSGSHDRLTGNSADNWLAGGSGNDTLLSSSGNDTLNGGTGNDSINGSSGIDTLVFTASTARAVDLSVTTAQDTKEGKDIITDIENVVGGSGNDRLFGSSGTNEIDGAGGDDYLRGGDGNDTLTGGTGNDIINGNTGIDTLEIEVRAGGRVDLSVTTVQTTGEGSDQIVGIENIEGGDGKDRFYGNSYANRFEGDDGHDYLYGRAGNDRLIGDDGNDTLRGGAGADRMTGGDDEDVFYFESSAGTDRIDDFENGEDRIEFGSGANSMSDLSFSQVGSATYIKYAGGTVIVDDIGYYFFDSSDFIFS